MRATTDWWSTGGRQCVSGQPRRLLVVVLACLLLFVAPSPVDGGKAPRITEHPSDVSVPRNDPGTLQCKADGIPIPIIEWYHDGELVISSAANSGGGSSSSSSGGGSGGGGGGSSSSRILLPGGDLFFLRVVQTRKENDAGVWWCLARNSHGWARSRNATLTVSYLQQEFRVMPQPVQGIVGDSVVLECEPPRGHPEPQVRWKKNGQALELDLDLGVDSERIRVEENGNLYIAKLASSDQGRYTCVALNIVGTRETPPALLTVHARPSIIRPPQDVTTLVGSDVNLECGITGDPLPTVSWRRLDGLPMPPNSRTRTGDINRTGGLLRIERISASDSGHYQCTAENAVGSSSASAHITVLVPPTWDSSSGTASSSSTSSPLPKEVRAYPGQGISLDCPVNGSPKPLVYWHREGRSGLLLTDSLASTSASQIQAASVSRWTVLKNGTLHIRDLRRDDSSTVWCAAVNDAGSIVARTRLEITSAPMTPPIVIEVGPANQTLPVKSPASLPCQAEGQPVKWSRDGEPMNLAVVSSTAVATGGQGSQTRPRISVTELGMLRIEDLQLTDAGTYTCEVGQGDQFAAWTASLAVASPTNPNVVFHRSPSDPMALPGSPSQPRLLHKSSTSLTIGWQSGSRMGASPLQGYTVEVFSSAEDDKESNGDGEGDGSSSSSRGVRGAQPGSWTWAGPVAVKRAWRIVSRSLKADQFTLHDLRPSTSYTFLVRAENGHGLSLPSPASPWFTTLPSAGNGNIQWQSAAEVEEARQRLSTPLLRLDQARAINSTSVRLSWQLLEGSNDGDSVIDSLHIWYRTVVDSSPISTDDDSDNDDSEDKVEEQQVTEIPITTMKRILPAIHQGFSSFVVTSLAPYTRYTFFLVPSYRNIEGQPSNSKTERTLEAAPAAPPLDLSIRQLNATSVLAQWLPPPSIYRNGNITAYQISVTLEGTAPSTLLANLTIPALPTSVVIGGLVTDATYSIRAAAWTLVGLGPPSPPTVHKMEAFPFSAMKVPPASSPPLSKQSNVDDSDSSGSHGVALMVQETWFILLLGGILLAILCLLVAALIVRRNLARRKALSALSKSDPDSNCIRSGAGDTNTGGNGVAGSVRGRDAFWSRNWSTTMAGASKEAEMDVHATLLPHASPASVQMANRPLVAPPEYAELLGHNANQEHHLEQQQQQAQLSLSSFLPRRNLNNHPAAYATTTLVNQRSINGTNSHHHMQQQQQQQHGFNNPYTSCAAFSASDSSGYTTDELGERNRRGLPSASTGGKNSRSRQGSNNNVVKLLPNLGEMFPPPPRHPPPSSPLLGGGDRTSNETNQQSGLKCYGQPLNTHSVQLQSVTNSPAMSKRNGHLSHFRPTFNAAAGGVAQVSEPSPLLSGSSSRRSNNSSSPLQPSNHYRSSSKSPAAQGDLHQVVDDDETDSESHEYAYAYHTPMTDNVMRSTAAGAQMSDYHQSQDIVHPHSNNGYMWVNSGHQPQLNPIQEYQHYRGISVEERIGGHQQYSLSSHIIPNASTSSPSPLYNQQSSEQSSFGMKNKSAQSHWDQHYDSDVIHDRNDTESSLYAEAHT